MSLVRPFAPQFGSNQVVVLAAATPQIKSVTRTCQVLRVYNSGAGDLYVRPYWSQTNPAPVASAVDYAVPPGADRLITIGELDTVSLYSLAGTTAQIMTGDNGVGGVG